MHLGEKEKVLKGAATESKKNMEVKSCRTRISGEDSKIWRLGGKEKRRCGPRIYHRHAGFDKGQELGSAKKQHDLENATSRGKGAL